MICFVLFHRSFHCSMAAATLTCLNSTDVPKLLDHCDQTFTLYKFRPFGPILDIRCDAKKSIKIWMKILISKKFSNFIQTLTFFDKVSGINMMKFQPNRTTFYKIKFCS